MSKLPFVVVDTTPGGHDPEPGDRIPVLKRFATEAEAAEYIATLPDYESGRYGLDGPAS
jgi:hypothetical protein